MKNTLQIMGESEVYRSLKSLLWRLLRLPSTDFLLYDLHPALDEPCSGLFLDMFIWRICHADRHPGIRWPIYYAWAVRGAHQDRCKGLIMERGRLTDASGLCYSFGGVV